MNKLKNEWILLGNEDDVDEKIKILGMKINKFSYKRNIKLQLYKYSYLDSDEESSVNVVKVSI